MSFRIWAPKAGKARVILPGPPDRELDLRSEGSGYFSGECEARAGDRYWIELDGRRFADPASRFQPEGIHGPSEVVDPGTFAWSDERWRGLRLHGQVFYELHVGTFTAEGTWNSAARRLDELADLGITTISLMPVAAFPGRFGWSYDGVALFAPTCNYGAPDDFRSFVDAAHAAGLGVLLDVVYNHFGPDGNFLRSFSNSWFTDRYENEWGDAIDFDGPNSEPVREFFRANAAYWIREFHLDGFRIDAPQGMQDHSAVHILTEICESARAAADGRSILMIVENEPQWAHLVRPVEAGGSGFDAQWNDDFERSAMAALTRRHEAYYRDYHGSAQEFISLFKRGYLYQGQRSMHQNKRRGAPAMETPAAAFVNFLQNHDQIANSARGERCHVGAGHRRFRVLTALLLLAPGSPMLFQGQEFAASSPFLFFADARPDLAVAVQEGRLDFLSQFASLALPETRAGIPCATAEETFRRCVLDHSERDRHPEILALHRDLLALRRKEPAIARQDARRLDGAVLGPETFVIRFFDNGAQDRLLVVNLGGDLRYEPAPEPLLAPPSDAGWRILWTSDAPQYGGTGTPELEIEGGWLIPGESAVVLKPLIQ